MARAEAYRLIAARVRHEVENLRDRTRTPFDAKGLRKRWKSERKKELVKRGGCGCTYFVHKIT